MTDDTRSQQIEGRIDRQTAGAIALNSAAIGMRTIAPQNMAELFEFAKMMAISGQCVRPHFRGNPGACLAIALQAFRTGADPFAVANQAYAVNDQIAYQAQYIHGVINTSGQLKKRLRPVYSGEGMSRKCLIKGEVVGEDEPLEYESPTLGAITPKNSPLWKSDPDQQLFYYSSRAWARRHLPEVILGMYTADDLAGPVIDVTPPPRPQREDFLDHDDAPSGDFSEGSPDGGHGPYTLATHDGEFRDFETATEAANAMGGALADAAAFGEQTLKAAWEDNGPLLDRVEKEDPVAFRFVCDALDAARRIVERRRANEPATAAPTAPEPKARAGRAPKAAQPTPNPEHPAPSAPRQDDPTLPVPAEAPPSRNLAPVGPAPTKADGTPDYRAWAWVKFLGAAKQQTDPVELSWLIADNEDTIQAYKSSAPKIDADRFQVELNKISRGLQS